MKDSHLLPSSELLAYAEGSLRKQFEGVSKEAVELCFDQLGELAVLVAMLPKGEWSFARKELVALTATYSSRLEAQAAIDLALAHGVFVKVKTKPQHYRPARILWIHWLGARHIARTDDEAEVLDYCHYGELFQMVAMLTGMVAKEFPALSAGLVKTFNDDAPAQDTFIHTGKALAMTCLAFGAVPPEGSILLDLVSLAYEWTQLDSQSPYRDEARAFLAALGRDEDLKDIILDLSEKRLGTLLELFHEDPVSFEDLDLYPAFACDLQVVVSHAGGPNEAMDSWFEKLGPSFSIFLPRAINHVFPPSPERDEFILYAVQKTLDAGDKNGIYGLYGLENQSGEAWELLQESMLATLGVALDEDLETAACFAMDALSEWEEIGPQMLHVLSSVLISEVGPELRIRAAKLLSAHPDYLSTMEGIFVRSLNPLLEDDDPLVRAAGMACLMILGSPVPGLIPIAFSLIADGVPPIFFEESFAWGLQIAPRRIEELKTLWKELGDDPFGIGISLELIEFLAVAILEEASLGPFNQRPPLHQGVKDAVLTYLLDLIAKTSVDLLKAKFLKLAASIAPEMKKLTPLIRQMQRNSEDDEVQEELSLALASTRDKKGIAEFLKNASHGSPNASRVGAFAATIAIHAQGDFKKSEELMLALRLRAQQEGPQQENVKSLLVQLERAPVLGRKALLLEAFT